MNVKKQTMNDVFLRACKKQSVPYTPVWYMRQAGRYQPEYRAIRQKYSFFEISHHPEVCAEVTRLPVEQLGVDAAILFADIMTPLKATGVDLDIVEGVGPVIEHPIASLTDVRGLRELLPERDVPYVIETVKLLNEQLSVPLIGFAGAPFTLASYLIEGGPSKDYHRTKGFMYAQPDVWRALLDRLAETTIVYLEAQIAAGAKAVQVFDSWVGAVGSQDYSEFIAPTMRKIFNALKKTGAVTIYFASGAGHLLREWNQLPVDVISLDWRTSVREARALGVTKALQGNIDPSLLLAPLPLLKERAKQVIDEAKEAPGHIFNLGHGVFPEAKVEKLKALTDFIHNYSKSL